MSRCVHCGSASICEHKRQKYRCVQCLGGSICEHKRRKSTCTICCGSGVCEHKRRKSTCKDCNGAEICHHNHLKPTCKDCNGSSICQHKRRKSQCIECHGSSICEHKRQTSQCRLCRGTSFCEHNRLKSQCVQCSGSRTCKYHHISLCSTLGTPKYEGYCVRCYSHLFPDKPVSKNFRTKERCVADHIRLQFPDYDIVLDKKVHGGCSKRRPDISFDFGSHVIIIEVDEHEHQDYSCENKRIMEIFHDHGDRPMVVIRFNPDAYVDQAGTKISSCWGFDAKGVARVKPKQRDIWQSRLLSLTQHVQQFCDSPPEKEVTFIHLFYSQPSHST